MTALLEKLLPVILIITVGWFLRKKKIISGNTVNELKQLIVNIALPCTLFLSFSKTNLEARYLLIIVMVFALCMAMYGIGFLLKHKLPQTFGSIFTPWFMSGFEFGMIGIGLFAALFGTENLPLITLIGLGHEFFAWFVAIPYVQLQSSGRFSLAETLGRFIRTPVILGILGGLIANLTGIYAFLHTVFWGNALLGTMLTISNILVPLILMIVGYTLVIEKDNTSKVIKHITFRLIPILAIGSLVLFLIHQLAGAIDPLFNVAFYAFLILPPSYLVPVFVKDNEEERHFFSQTVVYYTVVSFIGYVVLLLV
jgi:predicted permease